MTSKIGAALLICAAVVTAAGCTSGQQLPASNVPPCTQLLEDAIAYERIGIGDINSILQDLADHCSNEYSIAVDYISHSTESSLNIESCDELIRYGIRPESVTLLEEDGKCSFTGAEITAGPEWPEGGLGWDRAHEHAGTVQRVCGPLMSIRETEYGTFVNVGRDYPSTDRFTFVFWDIYLDYIEAGATICGTGEVYLYEGIVTQMELWDPAELEIWI